MEPPVHGLKVTDYTCDPAEGGCGQKLGEIERVGNVSILILEGPTFRAAIQRTTYIQCAMCGKWHKWNRDPQDR